MHVFTSGRDYRPHTAFGSHLPPNTLYVRVLVAAEHFDPAGEELRRINLGRYEESLRGPNDPDGPATAIEAYVRDQGITTPAVFAAYRIDTDALGTALAPPRLLVARVTDDGLAVIGRVRVVSMGRPDQPHPVHRIVPDDDQADPVPVVGRPEEGPTDDVPLVESPIAYPVGALGSMTKNAERRLADRLPEIAREVARIAAVIEDAKRSPDPRLSWNRQSDRLLDLSRELAACAAKAHTVETVLHAGI